MRRSKEKERHEFQSGGESMQTLKATAIAAVVAAYAVYMFSTAQPKDGVLLSVITNAILALALGRGRKRAADTAS